MLILSIHAAWDDTPIVFTVYVNTVDKQDTPTQYTIALL